MALRRISEIEFEGYNFTKSPTLIGLVKEKFWFANDEANIISTVLLDLIDKDWSYMLMALDEDGMYRPEEFAVSLATAEEATAKVQDKMEEIAKTGKINKDIYNSTLFDKKSPIIIDSINDEVKRFFKKYPHKLYDISPRKFEELIASILEDLGFSVELTQATRDGGRDIIAHIKNAVTDFLAYVECKKYAPDNKIDVGIIRQVTGVHYLEKPSKSIIVTTSFFTKDAQDAAKKIEQQLALKDYNDLKQWLEKY